MTTTKFKPGLVPGFLCLDERQNKDLVGLVGLEPATKGL